MRRLLLALLLVLLASPAWGVPAFDAMSNPTPAFDWTVGASSVSWTHTVTGSNTVLCVHITTGGTVSTVTYAGAALTRKWGPLTVDLITGEYWCKSGPAAGANTVVVTFTAASFYNVNAVSYTAVDQATSFGTAVTATGNSTAASVNCSSASGEIVVDGVSVRDGGSTDAPTVGAGQTSRFNNWDTTSKNGGAGSEEAGAATVTMSWAFTDGKFWGIGCLPLKPVSSTAIRHRVIQQ